MSSQILQIAGTAMAAMRKGLQVRSQNVANAQTPGYIRQRPVLVPLSNAGSDRGVTVGSGVAVAEVERLRNQCLEAQIVHQEGQLGQQETQADSLARLQATFGDLNGSGLSQALGSFFNALETLQTDPGSAAARREVLFAAETFAGQTREMSGYLSGEQGTLDDGLQQQVAEANGLLHQVAELNAKIMPLGDSSAGNDLRVTREQAIRQLANLCGVNSLDQDNWSQDVLLGGVRLVEGSHVTELTLERDPADSSQWIIRAGALDVDSDVGGRIAGNREATRLVENWQSGLDDMAQSLADAVNAVHRQGYDLTGDTGGDLFAYTAAHLAQTIAVRQAVQDDPNLLAAAETPEGLPGDAGNAQALLALRQQKLLGGGTTTVEEGYRQILADVGLEARRAEDAKTARQQLVDTLDTRYSEEAGVSLDDEAVEIMRLQQVFNASLKLVRMADEMMQEVLGLVD